MTDFHRAAETDQNQHISVDLLGFYDEFVDFQSQCAFFCDAVTTMLIANSELDKPTLEGICSYSGQIKAQIAALKHQLKTIHDKSCRLDDASTP